jgi:hypothetical protein
VLGEKTRYQTEIEKFFFLFCLPAYLPPPRKRGGCRRKENKRRGPDDHVPPGRLLFPLLPSHDRGNYQGKEAESVAVCKEDGSDDEMINMCATVGGLVRGAVFFKPANYKKNQSYYYFPNLSLTETRGLGLDLHCVLCHILWRNVTRRAPSCHCATQEKGVYHPDAAAVSPVRPLPAGPSPART